MAYKKIKTYKKGYLKVDKEHEIYYELSGNSKGEPVLFVHGAPDGLKPGEEKAYDVGPEVERFFPTFIRVKFSVYPYDSNTENNDAEAIYLIWGHFFMTPTKFIKIKDI